MIALKYFKIFILSLGLFILLMPFGLAGIDYRTLIGFFAYFGLTLFLIKRYQGQLPGTGIFLVIVLAQCLLPLPTILQYFNGQIWSLPLMVSVVAGSFTGFLFAGLSRPINVLVFCVVSMASLALFISGWDYWLHKVNFGTFTGRVTAYDLPKKFEALGPEQRTVERQDIRNKITLMDFWTTPCGACFEKFPQVEAAYEKYAGDSAVAIMAVNIPIEEDKPDQAFEVIKKEGYKFPVVVLKDEGIAEEIGVKSYPTSLVVDQNAQVIYRGNIEGAVKMIEELRSNPATVTQ
jgi:thiol-disulfide isomerase/thioredoxin